MPNRILKESICTSDTIEQLTPFQETFFYRLIVNCDDYGRFDARPVVLKSRLFPLRDDLRLPTIEDALRKLCSLGTVTRYEVSGKPFLQIEAWDRHQSIRAKKSKYPEPQKATSRTKRPKANEQPSRAEEQPLQAAEQPSQASESTCKQLHANEINCMQMHADESNCKQMLPYSYSYSYSNSYSKSKSNSAGAGAREDGGGGGDGGGGLTTPFITDEEARALQQDHDEVLDAAARAGFRGTDGNRDGLLALYAKYGKAAVLEGIATCVKRDVLNLGFLEGCIRREGKPKAETQGGKAKPGKVLTTQNYAQREYTDDHAQADGWLLDELKVGEPP